MRFCPNCGNPLGGSPRYCAGCATQVGPGNETAPAPPGEPWTAALFQASNEPSPVAQDPSWNRDDPDWAGRHPAREPEGSPWPASAPPWADSRPPWAVSPCPAAEDQASAVITMKPGPTPPAGPLATPGAARPARRGPLFADRRPWLSPGPGMTLTAVVTTVALLVTGGVAAWQVGAMRSRLPATISLATRNTRAARIPGPGPATARAASAGSSTTGSLPTGSPTTGSPTAGTSAAHGAVTVAPAAAVQPHVHRVVMLLDSYFSAINRHDFPAYSSLFIPAIRVGMPNFGTAYQSTRDSRAMLTGLTATGPHGLAAMVTFVSHQNPAASPDHAACDRWHVTLFLRHATDGYHIRRHRPGFPLDTFRACR